MEKTKEKIAHIHSKCGKRGVLIPSNQKERLLYARFRCPICKVDYDNG